jgi:CRISPR/Cas system-associated exonuclease Cas4 (RecB family)
VSDERAALPSASSAHRYASCPGSFLLEQCVTEPETSSADATMGNRIHAVLAGENLYKYPADQIVLTSEESEIVDLCTHQEAQLVQAVFRGSKPTTTVRERRFWSLDSEWRKLWSGKPDVVHLLGDRVLVIDYKTGRGEVEHATGNLQLRALAVLASEHWEGTNEITVAIIQPHAGEPSVCTYAGEDIHQARVQIYELMDRVKRQGQPRVPSTEACKYCKAKPICPEAQAVVETLPATVQKESGEIVMSPDQIARFLEAAPLAEAVIESVRGKARRILEAGGTIPGWKLKPGAVRESIVKPEVVFGRFVQAGGTQADFAKIITVTKTKLRDSVKAVTGTKGKELDAHVEAMLDGCTETKQTAPSLVKEKEVA